MGNAIIEADSSNCPSTERNPKTTTIGSSLRKKLSNVPEAHLAIASTALAGALFAHPAILMANVLSISVAWEYDPEICLAIATTMALAALAASFLLRIDFVADFLKRSEKPLALAACAIVLFGNVSASVPAVGTNNLTIVLANIPVMIAAGALFLLSLSLLPDSRAPIAVIACILATSLLLIALQHLPGSMLPALALSLFAVAQALCLLAWLKKARSSFRLPACKEGAKSGPNGWPMVFVAILLAGSLPFLRDYRAWWVVLGVTAVILLASADDRLEKVLVLASLAAAFFATCSGYVFDIAPLFLGAVALCASRAGLSYAVVSASMFSFALFASNVLKAQSGSFGSSEAITWLLVGAIVVVGVAFTAVESFASTRALREPASSFSDDAKGPDRNERESCKDPIFSEEELGMIERLLEDGGYEVDVVPGYDYSVAVSIAGNLPEGFSPSLLFFDALATKDIEPDYPDASYDEQGRESFMTFEVQAREKAFAIEERIETCNRYTRDLIVCDHLKRRIRPLFDTAIREFVDEMRRYCGYEDK